MKLTKKQKGFADDYIDTGNATKSALNNYNVKNENTASSIGHENLRKPDIKQYIQDNASMAISNIVTLANEAKNENVKLKANVDILDRAGHKPVERQEVSGDITIELVKYENKDTS